MNLGLAATVFVIVGLAELPDKTNIAVLLMATKSRPLFVWIGAAAALVTQMAVGVLFGGLISKLPHRAVEIVVTLFFLGGALYLLVVKEEAEQEKAEEETEGVIPARAWRVIATAYTVIFLAEFGDLTQILVANFTAKSHDPLSVFIGSSAALILVPAIGAFSGQALLKVVPLAQIRQAGGVVLLGFAGYSIYTLVH